MNYPFLGYNTPGLQLGQSEGLSGGNMSTPYTMSPEANMNFTGNYSGLGTNPTFNSVGQSMGFDMPYSQGNAGMFGQLGSWASQNADLLKAGVGLATGGIGAWNGFNQNKLMEKSMNQQAGQFREQMDLSKQSINRNIEDRQRARVASNPTAYESVDSYMKKYGVK